LGTNFLETPVLARGTPLAFRLTSSHSIRRPVRNDGQVRYETAGLVDAHGNYKLGFNGDQSGAAAGDCKVTIQPRHYQELANSNSKRIPGRYREQSKTPLTVTVREGDNTFNFELR